jgi:hypothetical protein
MLSLGFKKTTNILLPRRKVSSLWNRMWLSESDFIIQPIVLISGTITQSSIRKWKTISDRDYQGESVCEVVHNEEGIHFKGKVYTPPIVEDDNDDKKLSIKKGFCAIKGVASKIINLRDHEGLELVVSSDVDIKCTVNMTCQSYFQDDLYQVDIQVPGGLASQLYIPFHAFRLTARGKERLMQRVNDDLQCEALGILVTEPNSKSSSITYYACIL